MAKSKVKFSSLGACNFFCEAKKEKKKLGLKNEFLVVSISSFSFLLRLAFGFCCLIFCLLKKNNA